METDSFVFSKDAEAISRRASFASSLETGGVVRGYLQKRSTTGHWNKRWFAVHGHYLSYYKADPNQVCRSCARARVH